MREYQETQQSLTMQNAATRKAQREALNGKIVVLACLLGRAYKIKRAHHVRNNTGFWIAACSSVDKEEGNEESAQGKE